MPIFKANAVTGLGVTEDAEYVVIQMKDAGGEALEFAIEATAMEEVQNAIVSARGELTDRRVAMGKAEPSIPIPSEEILEAEAFRYAVSDRRERLVLEILTTSGPVKVGIPAAHVPTFAEATARNAAWLALPPKRDAN